MNRLLNTALGHNCSKDAKDVLKFLYEDELKEERKKATAAANETAEAKALKADKKAASQAKAKATRERKKAEKEAAKQLQIEPTIAPAVRNTGDIIIAGSLVYLANIQ